MNASNDVRWVHKSERAPFFTIAERNARPSFRFPSPLVRLVQRVVPDPQKDNSLWVRYPSLRLLAYICVEDSNDTGVPVRVCIFRVLRQKHYVGVVPRVQGILISSQVVCCIIEADYLVYVQTIPSNINFAAFCVRKLVCIG